MSQLAYQLQNTLHNTGIWGGYCVWQRNRQAFARAWRVEIGGLAVEPFIMLMAIGLGLGSYISNIDGMEYIEFLAPGMIASYAMFHASFDSTYGAYLRMESHHIYEAILYTPLGPGDIVLGEVLWAASKSVISALFILILAAILGVVSSPLAVLVIPVSYAIGLMIGAIAMIMTATATTIGSMNNFFTLFILPMFYVSGTFFPLERLPEPVQVVAWALPLTPAAALVRGLMTGDLSWWMLLWMLEMLAFGLAGLWLAMLLMRRRLIS